MAKSIAGEGSKVHTARPIAWLPVAGLRSRRRRPLRPVSTGFSCACRLPQRPIGNFGTHVGRRLAPRTFPQVRNRFLALAAYRENPAMGCMRVDRNHVPGIGCLAGIHAARIEPLIVDNGQASWTGLPGKRHAGSSLVRAILRHQPMQRAVAVRVRVDPDHSIAGQSERSSRSRGIVRLAAENMSTNQDVRLVLNSLPLSMASRRRRRSLPARHRPEWPKTATPDQDRDTTGLTTAARTGRRRHHPFPAPGVVAGAKAIPRKAEPSSKTGDNRTLKQGNRDDRVDTTGLLQMGMNAANHPERRALCQLPTRLSSHDQQAEPVHAKA